MTEEDGSLVEGPIYPSGFNTQFPFTGTSVMLPLSPDNNYSSVSGGARAVLHRVRVLVVGRHLFPKRMAAWGAASPSRRAPWLRVWLPPPLLASAARRRASRRDAVLPGALPRAAPQVDVVVFGGAPVRSNNDIMVVAARNSQRITVSWSRASE